MDNGILPGELSLMHSSAAKHALDGAAVLVEGPREATFTDAIALGRNVGNGALVLDDIADAVAVVSAASVDNASPWQVCQQPLARVAVSGLTRCQQESERSSVSIGDGVDLGVATTSADADWLEVRPDFRPLPRPQPPEAF